MRLADKVEQLAREADENLTVTPFQTKSELFGEHNEANNSRGFREVLRAAWNKGGEPGRQRVWRAVFGDILAPTLRVFHRHGFGFDPNAYAERHRLRPDERVQLYEALDRTPFRNARNVSPKGEPQERRFTHYSRASRKKTGLLREFTGTGMAGEV